MSGHNESFVLKSVDVRLTGQLAEYMHFALLLIKDLCDLIMGMDVPDQTAPKQTAGGSNPPGDAISCQNRMILALFCAFYQKFAISDVFINSSDF